MAENKGQISRKTFGIHARMRRQRGPGAPPKKHLRKSWYESRAEMVGYDSAGKEKWQTGKCGSRLG